MVLSTEKAVFAAGCFWSIQDEFDAAEGVIATRAGYIGGHVKNPTYEEVCTGATRHAEAVEVTFDPKKVSYGELLDIFWQIHDPTQLNKQGPDVGAQYRSAIFYTTGEQKRVAEMSLKEQQRKIKGRIVTEIIPASTFYEAEKYHQHYNARNRRKSCAL